MKRLNNADLDQATLLTLSKDEVEWCYNALDVCVAFEVFEAQAAEMDNVAKATAAFSHALMAPIFEMSLRGTLINKNQLDKTLVEFKAKKKKLAHNLERIVIDGIGLTEFNYRSVPQLKNLFYKVLGLKPVLKRNANGQYLPSTDRDAVEKLQNYWIAGPICRHLLALRDLDKKISFLETDLDEDGRMRTSYNIAGTNTGRLSSSASDFGTGTNNQNIERALRQNFVPDPGMKFCNIDLEQADSRNVGAICWELYIDSHGEEFAGAYLDACESGDLHTSVCRMAWTELEWDEENPRRTADQIAYREFSYRDMAKKLGHGTNYLGTPRTMAMHTKVESKMIEEFQKKYFGGFPAIKEWHSWVENEIHQNAQLTTPFYGRRRYFFGRPDDAATLREAVAYCPQSMTADAIDQGIINLWRYLPEVQLLIQVHDSILFQYPEHLEADIIPRAINLLKIKHRMKKGREFLVPVEAKIGWNWADFDKKNPDKNPSGLMAWKGPGADERKRPRIITERPKLSLANALRQKA